MGDGTKVSQKSALSNDGSWPFYASLYSGRGSILGWLTLTNLPDRDIGGVVTWFKLAQAKAKRYPGGFTAQSEVIGSEYRSVKDTAALNLGEGVMILEAGGLPQSVTNGFSLGANNKATGPNRLNLKIAASTGLLNGSMHDPATGRKIAVNGIALQKQNSAAGFFMGTDQSGRAYVGPSE